MWQSETSGLVFVSDSGAWWERVDVSKLGEDARYAILKYIVEKYGRGKVLEETGISRVILWRLLEGKSPVRPEYVKPLLKMLTQEEFERLVTARDGLRALGVLRDDDTVDYGLDAEGMRKPVSSEANP